MTLCTIDNPDTMARECWQDGRLLCSYSALLFMRKSARDPRKSAWDDLPAEQRFFGANVGPWKDGQILGDVEAIGLSIEQVHQHEAVREINICD